MSHATVDGRRHSIRVTQDLGDNYSVELYPTPEEGAFKRSEPYKNWPSPLVIKLKADSREHALEFALQHLKSLGRISDFQLSEADQPPPKEVPAQR